MSDNVGSSGTIACIDDILQERTKLILRLRESVADAPASKSLASRHCVERIVNYFDNRTGDIEDIVDTVRKDPETTKANMEKLDSLFDQMECSLKQQRVEAKEALQDMSPEEQKDFVNFFSAFTGFFKNFFSWLKDFVEGVILSIKRGLKMVKDFFSGLFSSIKTLISNAF